MEWTTSIHGKTSINEVHSITKPLANPFHMYLSEYHHTTISLICMSTHKASATRCHLEHQAWSGQPAIQALATAPLRRLTLSVLFTIMTTSYQTTCTVSERTSIKGTCQCKPIQSNSFALWQYLLHSVRSVNSISMFCVAPM